MRLDSGEFSLRRARLLTVVVLTFVGGGTVLANLSSQPVTISIIEDTLFKGKPAERAFGWPLAWYWQHRNATSAPRWPASRYSVLRLSANSAMWLAMFVAVSAACEWLLRLYRPRVRWRPRVTTVMVLTIVLSLTVLANLSVDAPRRTGNWEEFLYGWPLIWYWRLHWSSIPSAFYEEWGYSAVALGGNFAIWLLMLVVTAVTWERLTRRYRPGPRFSLRAMLVTVGAAGALCGLWITARNRAVEQEAILAWLGPNEEEAVGDWVDRDDEIFVRHWGPNWLDVVGAQRFRRYIVGVRVNLSTSANEPNESRKFFRRLSRLSTLRFLDIELDCHPRWPREFTDDMAAILGDMRQLRMLNFECHSGFRDSTPKATNEYLVAMGQLAGLERLRLSISTDRSRDLAYLNGLTSLKTLALNIYPSNYRVDDRSEKRGNDNGSPVLARLPVLPQLEGIDLHDTPVSDDDIACLARFPRLKWLDLSGTAVTEAGLAKLAALESLEEAAIDEQIATAAGLKSLLGLTHLTRVHIAVSLERTGDSASAIVYDGQEWVVLPSELDGVRSALHALPEHHQRILIDTNYDGFRECSDLEPPWLDGDHRKMDMFVERWLGP